MAVTPRFLAAYKLKEQRRRIVHEVGICRTMAELTDPLVAGLPADINNQSLTPYFPLPGVQPTPRTYNFSQFFVGGTNPLLATIRN